LSYAFGFFTVTLHTWRLGLPVVELIEPIYIWIGLPLTIVAFFWKHLLSQFRKNASALATQFQSSISTVSGRVAPAEIDLVAQLLAVLAALPGIRLLLRPSLQRFIRNRLDPIDKRAKATNPAAYEAQVRVFHRLAGLSRFFDAIGGALNLLSWVLVIVAALAAYVWVLYPSIPKSLGGGEATPVQIVVEVDSLPPELLVQNHGSMPAGESKDVTTRVLAVDLLYLTKDFFFVELESGARLSIRANAVKTVVWST
jgi:hypothetical protein